MAGAIGKLLISTIRLAVFMAQVLSGQHLFLGMPQAYGQIGADDDFIRRPATKHDLDDIVEIVRAGFPDDPEVDYRFPLREKFPEDYLKWTKVEYAGYLAQPDKFVVNVMETDVAVESRVMRKPIALAVWDIAVLTEVNNTDQGLNKRRDANKEHYLVYNEVVTICFEKYFQKYEEAQVHLWLIVTHPDYRRRGAATTLVDWGLDHADRMSCPVTVFASPLGEKLYDHLGFRKIANEVIQVDGEEEKLKFAVMERDPTDLTQNLKVQSAD